MRAILIDPAKQTISYQAYDNLEQADRLLKARQVESVIELSNRDNILVNADIFGNRGANAGGFMLPEYDLPIVGRALVVSCCMCCDCESSIEDFSEVIWMGEEETIEAQQSIIALLNR